MLYFILWSLAITCIFILTYLLDECFNKYLGVGYYSIIGIYILIITISFSIASRQEIKMTEFKFYHLVCDIDFVANQKIVGNYHTIVNERLEMKAIHKYKDAIWDMQGLMNNSIAIGNNEFDMFGNVTLYGITYDNDYIIMRHLELTL